MYSASRASASFLATVADAPLAACAGGSFDDPFAIAHDFGGGDVSGTIWDGVLNADHLAVGDANLSNAGELDLVRSRQFRLGRRF